MSFKILMVGDFHSLIHEKAISDAFKDMGHYVDNFEIYSFFKKKNNFFTYYEKIQVKLRLGPIIYQINNQLYFLINKNEYDFIFFYRPLFIKKNIFKIAFKKSKVYIYNNDDPFSSKYNKYFWNDFFNSLKYSHHIFYYRPKNKLDYLQLGHSNISLLRSYYIKNLNFTITPKKYIYDVVFIGHYENDGRDEVFKFLIENNIPLKLFGPEWNRSKLYSYFIEKIGIIEEVKENYNFILNSSKIALVLFSKLNNDTYTRRVFEIAATKTLMISEYTEDMNFLFSDNKEIIYYKNQSQLLKKINYFLLNEDSRDIIVDNAYNKILTDKHDSYNRALEIINIFEKTIIN